MQVLDFCFFLKKKKYHQKSGCKSGAKVLWERMHLNKTIRLNENVLSLSDVITLLLTKFIVDRAKNPIPK
jgi:hypothetical protein